MIHYCANLNLFCHVHKRSPLLTSHDLRKPICQKIKDTRETNINILIFLHPYFCSQKDAILSCKIVSNTMNNNPNFNIVTSNIIFYVTCTLIPDRYQCLE